MRCDWAATAWQASHTWSFPLLPFPCGLKGVLTACCCSPQTAHQMVRAHDKKHNLLCELLVDTFREGPHRPACPACTTTAPPGPWCCRRAPGRAGWRRLASSPLVGPPQQDEAQRIIVPCSAPCRQALADSSVTRADLLPVSPPWTVTLISTHGEAVASARAARQMRTTPLPAFRMAAVCLCQSCEQTAFSHCSRQASDWVYYVEPRRYDIIISSADDAAAGGYGRRGGRGRGAAA